MKATRILIIGLLVLLTGSAASEAQTLQRYWADLQGDNDQLGTPSDYYSFGRDSVGLDVVVLTPHANTCTDNRWNNVKLAAASYYAPGSFVAFSGWEWNSDTYGHKCAYFLTDDQPIYRPNNLLSDTPAEFYALFAGTNGVLHAAHPSLGSYSTNWNYFDGDLQPNGEIFSRWGTYETAASGRGMRDIWARGYHVGVLATSDSHTRPGVDGGLSCILAPALTRQAILDALQARHNYGTNGARIGLDFKVGSNMMGDQDNYPSGDAQIYVRLEGTAPLSRIEVRRSNQIVYTYAPSPLRTFVDVGAPLVYFKGQAEPPADWTSATFNETGWTAGRSGIGFANNDDVTVIAGMVNKYITLYTRQTFTVTDNTPQFLYLGTDYDDGFIAYIDGVEVLRANMPAGPVTSQTLAATVRNANLAALAVPGATVPPFYTNNGLASGVPTPPALDMFNLTAYAAMLTPGSHTLAIEIHNALLGSNDLTLIPKLFEVDPLTTATVNWTDTGATGDRWYDIKAIQIDGGTAWSSPIWLNPDAPPRPIATLMDIPADNGTALDLTWTKSVALDFHHYDIFVSDFAFTDAAGMSRWNPAPITNADSLHARITTFGGQALVRGQIYYVYVGAFDNSGKMNSLTAGCIASGAPADNIAPLPPGSISVIDTPADDGGSLRISWSPSPDDGGGMRDVQRYEIFRKKSSGSYGSTPLATRPDGTSTYYDNTTLDGTNYYYRIRANDGFNVSTYTVDFGPLTSVNNGGLAEPKSVAAIDRPADQGGWIKLTWSLIAQDTMITRYNVHRTTTPGTYGSSPKGWVPRGVNTFWDSTATNDTDYYYVVVSDSAGAKQSTYSLEVGPVRALDNTPPPAITAFTATNTAQGGSVALDWSGYSESGQSDLDGYNVYYKSSSFSSISTLSPVMMVPKGTFTATVNGLNNGTTYYFAVAPTDLSGNQVTSVITRSAKPTDTVAPVFAGLSTITPGDASLTLGWSAAQDNSQPITYQLYQSLTPTGFNYTTPTVTLSGTRPLVPMGAAWRFLKGTSAPPVGWKDRTFDDNGWLLGEGAFGYDTGNIYKPVTVLSDMNGVYTSVFFRANFNLTTIPGSLVLGVLVDDGYICYLNGVEVSRDNLTSSTYSATASKGISVSWNAVIDLASPTNYNPNPTLKLIDLSAYAGLLVSGRNTIAFQVHNYKKTNADFLFLAELSEANVKYEVTGLSPSQTYYYVMRCSDGAGNKNTNTNVVGAKPLQAPSASPVAGLSAVKSGSSVVLRWSPVSTDSVNNPFTPHHYSIYRGTTAGFVPDVRTHTNLLGTATSATYTDAGVLANSTNYFYRVTAVSASGRESWAPSTLAIKAQQSLTFALGQENVYWISVPYLSGIPDAQTLVTDLNRGPIPGPVRRIARLVPQTQALMTLSWDGSGWVGDNFPVISGEAYAITLQSNLSTAMVGAHNPNLGFNLAFRSNLSNIYWLSLPYNADYTDAMSLLQHLNNGPLATTVSKVMRLDPATGRPLGYLYFAGQWLGQDFTITPGEGYGIVLKNNLSGWRPRVPQ